MRRVIRSSESPIGKVYFNDGTEEDVFSYIIYSSDNVVFYTKTNKYLFRSWWEPVEKEMLYVDNNPRITMAPTHKFYKYRINSSITIAFTEINVGTDLIAADIDRVVIFEEDPK